MSLVGLVRGIALQLILIPPRARVQAIIDEGERSTLRELRSATERRSTRFAAPAGPQTELITAIRDVISQRVQELGDELVLT